MSVRVNNVLASRIEAANMQLADDSVKHFTMAGYSGTPLPQKLGIKPGMIVVVIDPPENYRKLLAPIPGGVNFAKRPVGTSKFIHLFVKERRVLQSHLQSLR